MKKILLTLIVAIFNIITAQSQTSETATLVQEGINYEEAGEIAKAETCYVKAAEMGNSKAWLLAGNLYAPAVSKTPNAQKAIEYLEKAVLYDSRAAILLGITYYIGDNVTQPNYQKALIYLKKASEIGFTEANGIVGTIYCMGGYGVAPDPDQALLWLMPAAENGDKSAMYNYGLILINGTQSLEPDFQAGLKYIKQAAAKNHTAAQKWLKDRGDTW